MDYPGVWSQLVLMKRAICEASGGDWIPALNMSANLESSAMAIEVEEVSFHSNPKEGEYQRMFKLQYSCAHFTC